MPEKKNINADEYLGEGYADAIELEDEAYDIPAEPASPDEMQAQRFEAWRSTAPSRAADEALRTIPNILPPMNADEMDEFVSGITGGRVSPRDLTDRLKSWASDKGDEMRGGVDSASAMAAARPLAGTATGAQPRSFRAPDAYESAIKIARMTPEEFEAAWYAGKPIDVPVSWLRDDAFINADPQSIRRLPAVGGYGTDARSHAEVADLLASVEKSGVKKPIGLYKDAAGRLGISDGTHRVLVSELAGHETIPVRATPNFIDREGFEQLRKMAHRYLPAGATADAENLGVFGGLGTTQRLTPSQQVAHLEELIAEQASAERAISRAMDTAATPAEERQLWAAQQAVRDKRLSFLNRYPEAQQALDSARRRASVVEGREFMRQDMGSPYATETAFEVASRDLYRIDHKGEPVRVPVGEGYPASSIDKTLARRAANEAESFSRMFGGSSQESKDIIRRAIASDVGEAATDWRASQASPPVPKTQEFPGARLASTTARVGRGVAGGLPEAIAAPFLLSAMGVQQIGKTGELGPQLEFIASQPRPDYPRGKTLTARDVAPDVPQLLAADPATREDLYSKGIISNDLYIASGGGDVSDQYVGDISESGEYDLFDFYGPEQE